VAVDPRRHLVYFPLERGSGGKPELLIMAPPEHGNTQRAGTITLRNVDPRSLFRTEEVERARAYHRPLYLAWPARLAVDMVVLAAIAFTALGDALFDPLDALPWWSQTVALTVIVIGVTTLLTLPISFAAGYMRERAWGFSTQTSGAWAGDRAKALAVEVVLGCAVMLGLVGLARAAAWSP
jgi:CAAX prenyl protease-like protein